MGKVSDTIKKGGCEPRGGPGHAGVAKLIVVLVTHVHMRRL